MNSPYESPYRAITQRTCLPGPVAPLGDRMRQEFTSRMDVDITEVIDMEVAIHHLRVPEMA